MEEVPIEEIKPNPLQPRRNFDREALTELAQSVREFGVIQPVIIRQVGTEYQLIAGERRLRAAREAGLSSVPAIVRESTETSSLEMALIENIHRESLNGIEEASAYQQLLEDFGITHDELSRRLGKSRSAITNTLRLLDLPSAVKLMVAEGTLTSGHARALLALDDADLQVSLAKRARSGALSVRQLEDLVRRTKEEATPSRRGGRDTPPRARKVARGLEEHLHTRVRVSIGKSKGRINIEFSDLDHLESIYKAIVGFESEPPSEGEMLA